MPTPPFEGNFLSYFYSVLFLLNSELLIYVHLKSNKRIMRQIKFTSDELKIYNGENGEPVYVSYKGKVYDVTEGNDWTSGLHMGMHKGGVDLTDMMDQAPHRDDVLS